MVVFYLSIDATFRLLSGYVHPSYENTRCERLNLLSNKATLIKNHLKRRRKGK
jgi:hypothetical protein